MAIPRILHYPGSKWSMANWIISHFPDHSTYLEPYFGSGAVFFNKQRSHIETINDTNMDVINLFDMVRKRPEELANLVAWTPYSRDEYYRSYEYVEDELERARRFLVRTWQAIGAKTSDRTGWRNHKLAAKSPHKLSSGQWIELPEKILRVTDRLKGVQIENKKAISVIESYQHTNCLIYADPPYLLETRKGRRIYKDEMTTEDHEELLEVLDNHSGPVILSGYASPLYDNRLKHWKRETLVVKAEAGATREEVLWINLVAAEHGVYQESLF